MSNWLSCGVVRNTVCHPSAVKSRSTSYFRSPSDYQKANAVQLGRVPAANGFMESTLTVRQAALWRRTSKIFSMVPQAISATVPASELAGKFNLDAALELQVTVRNDAPGCLSQINFEVSNSTGSLILHWGSICHRRKEWSLSSRHPDGTKIYKDKALRTPFVNSGSNSTITLEVDDPEVQAIEFCILDESQNKWYKNNDENFVIKLSGKFQKEPFSDIPSVSLPENLVQIQAYLRWERKGRKTYTPEEEKEEYDSARRELLEQIRSGTSLEDLKTRLTMKTDNIPEANARMPHILDEIPNDLVQMQAYIRWEKAGKPNYLSEQQLMEFEEARKELQLELDKGTSLSDLREKVVKGNIQTKASNQLKPKSSFTAERIQRKRRDLLYLLNKLAPQTREEKNFQAQKSPTEIELCSKTIEENAGGYVLNRRIFKLNDKELLVLVTSSHAKMKVYIVTNYEGPLVLHWGLSMKHKEWMAPPSSTLPRGSTLLDNSCETPFVEVSPVNPLYQTVEIEIDGLEFSGMSFVLHSEHSWIKDNGSDFYVDFITRDTTRSKDAGDGRGMAKALLDRISEMESEAQRSLMHRFNIAADLIDQARDFEVSGLAGILVWMRFMATRQLLWNKNYNVKPREISNAQGRLTNLLKDIYESCPQYREILRIIMSTIGRGGEGDVGQRIRDEILVIQRKNDCKGGMMEEWHQKLHNNTNPDDVVICQALIDYIQNEFDISVYWSTLNKNGLTKERLLSYDRAIHSEPNFREDQKEVLLRDLGHYLRTLKAVHSGADIESAIATCMGYKSKGEGFMVGVEINPVGDLPPGLLDLLEFILDHVEDKMVEPLLEALLEARAELHQLLLKPHERLRDLIFLDIALDSTVRTVIERGYEELNNSAPEKIMYIITLVVENLALSSDNNEDLVYCLKGWSHSLQMSKQKDDQWALSAKSCLDRTRFALSSKAEYYHDILQPSAEYLGSLLGVDQRAISIFTEEVIRGGSAASVSMLINRLDPVLRKVAHLGSWQVISPVEVVGYVVVVDELLAVQNKCYERPTIIVAKHVKGVEEIPNGVVAVLTPDMPDVLSHVSVRARSSKVCFATCFDANILNEFQDGEGKLFRLEPASADIIYRAVKESELLDGSPTNTKDDHLLPSVSLVKKEFGSRYAILADKFTNELVGAKSRNIAYLKGRLPSWIGVPTSIALPFGVFEKVLSDDINEEVDKKIHELKNRLAEGDFNMLEEIREAVLQLVPPPQLVKELKETMHAAGMPWPGDEGQHRWEQAWMAIKKVWASKWNERAYFSVRKVMLDHDYICMAVLVQQIINADYAFVIHTTNPLSGDSSEIYAEVVKGLGETLVGAYPGRALSFICKKNDLDSPKLLGYPSKQIGLFMNRSIIFRSDSNGEDLEGYAGAGLYDSVPMDEEEKVILDYSSDPLIIDRGFRNTVLANIAKTGNAVEHLYGSAQDIEGVVKDGKIFVVQTRPQM